MYWGQVDLNSMCAYFADPDRVVSANYGISKDGEICLSVDEKNRAWTSNNIDNDGKAVTIEIASDMTPPYTMTQAAFNALVNLGIDVCRRNRKRKLLWIPDKDKALSYALAADEMLLTVHWWFCKTVCPGEWLMQRMGDLAERVTALLAKDVPEGSGEDADDGPEAVTPPADPAGQEPAPPPDQAKPTGTQARDLAKLTQRQIVDAVGPLFTQEQRRTGILASVAMAQFLLECGYCQSPLAQEANNCFGMKCYLSGNTWPGSAWDGESKYVMDAQEQNPDGSWFSYKEAFRAYPDIEASIADHSAYLLGAMNGDALRYAGLAGCTDCRKAARIIKDGGYATGLSYVNDLLGVIDLWDLSRWDLPQEQAAPQPGNSSQEQGNSSQEQSNSSQEQGNSSQEQSNSSPGPGGGVWLAPEEWNAIRAAVAIADQVIRKHESEG